jgi:hypothetical protein
MQDLCDPALNSTDPLMSVDGPDACRRNHQQSEEPIHFTRNDDIAVIEHGGSIECNLESETATGGTPRAATAANLITVDMITSIG